MEEEKLKKKQSKDFHKNSKEKELKHKEIDEKDKLWKKTRNGLFIFIFFHMIFEIIISETGTSGETSIGVPIVVNYMISRYFIKKDIYKKSKQISKPIIYGIKISLIVFSIRLALGIIAFSVIT